MDGASILKYAIMGFLLVLSYEDIRYRSIKIITLIQFGILSMVRAFILEMEWIEIGLNVLFVFILFVFMILYIRIRFGSVKGLNRSYLGLGDILLWILFVPLLECPIYERSSESILRSFCRTDK